MATAAGTDDFDPTSYSYNSNYGLLASHVLQKGFQAGSLIGAVIVAPVLCYRRNSFTAETYTKAVAYSNMVGTVLSGVMLGAKTPSIDKEGLEDRVYRLHYNQGQNRTDQFSEIGSLVGVAATAALVSVSPLALVGGAGIGSALGIAAHVITAEKQEKGPNAMVEELKR